jgi:hypothetical protein
MSEIRVPEERTLYIDINERKTKQTVVQLSKPGAGYGPIQGFHFQSKDVLASKRQEISLLDKLWLASPHELFMLQLLV